MYRPAYTRRCQHIQVQTLCIYGYMLGVHIQVYAPSRCWPEKVSTGIGIAAPHCSKKHLPLYTLRSHAPLFQPEQNDLVISECPYPARWLPHAACAFDVFTNLPLGYRHAQVHHTVPLSLTCRREPVCLPDNQFHGLQSLLSRLILLISPITDTPQLVSRLFMQLSSTTISGKQGSESWICLLKGNRTA